MRARLRQVLAWLAGLLLVLFVTGLLFSGRGLPSLEGRTQSRFIEEADATQLARAIGPLNAEHPGLSGIYPLADGHDAFAARALLADAAEHALDIQYYIWRNDVSGLLLAQALKRAADRGVRVRLLLDDNNTPRLDPLLAALDAHPRIEVRLFNPFVYRGWRAWGYLTDFARLNRRMHNKTFTADSQATIVGGRNVGDEYFNAADGMLFIDLDVLAVGPVVREVAQDFDRYWSSASSYPAERLLDGSAQESARGVDQTPEGQAYLRALKDAPLLRELMQGRLPLEWAPARLVSDDPAKGLGQAAPEDKIGATLAAKLGAPQQALYLVSPYFVPTAEGTEALVALAASGVRISILTNALEATDVSAVHAGYAKRRKDLLRAGIRIYELRRTPGASPIAADDRGLTGSSASSLHAKTFAMDGARVFVGSFNLDPRSARLNTEMGLLIDSPAMARELSALFAERIPAQSYEVRLGPTGALQWVDRQGGSEQVLGDEPGMTLPMRLWLGLLAVLPIEWLL